MFCKILPKGIAGDEFCSLIGRREVVVIVFGKFFCDDGGFVKRFGFDEIIPIELLSVQGAYRKYRSAVIGMEGDHLDAVTEGDPSDKNQKTLW